jgi:hypothetical protein
MEGLTGKVNFDAEGFRSNFLLDIVELRKEGLTKVPVQFSARFLKRTQNHALS